MRKLIIWWRALISIMVLMIFAAFCTWEATQMFGKWIGFFLSIPIGAVIGTIGSKLTCNWVIKN